MAKSKGQSQKKASTKAYEQAQSYAKQAYTNGKNGFDAASSLFNPKGLEEVAELSKQHLDAVAQTTSLWAQGCQEINNAWMSFAQQSLQSGLSTARSLMDCKSVQDAVDLQTAYARNLFEGMLSESSRISELSVRVANEAFEPVRDRVNATVEKMLKNAAA